VAAVEIDLPKGSGSGHYDFGQAAMADDDTRAIGNAKAVIEISS
jgi:hypothetical protein